MGGQNRIFEAYCTWQERFGNTWRIDFSNNGMNFVTVCHPDDIRQVFAAEGKYPYGPAVLFGKMMNEGNKAIGAPPFIAGLEGEEWKKARGKLQKDIFVPSVAQSYLPLLSEPVAKLADMFPSLPLSDNFVIASLEMFHNVLSGRDLGITDGPLEQNPLYKFVTEGKKWSQKVVEFILARDEDKPLALEQFKAIWNIAAPISHAGVQQTLKEISIWKDKPVKPYAVRLAERDEESFKEVYSGGTVMDLLLAAFDTTASLLELIIFNLASNPEAQERLYQEVNAVTKGGPLLEQHLKSVPYLKACLKEVYRLNPATPTIGRVLESEIVVSGGYKIPPKVLVMVSGVPWCRNEKYFPDANSYKPERWQSNQSNEISNQAYLLHQFGFGPRMCIGARIAETETMAFTSAMVQRYKWNIDPEHLRDVYLDTTTSTKVLPKPPINWIKRV
uniref:Cytochrome P450 n=1 Tax=Arcella intermedia TaxID=1963864 RepID=A0A6B2L3I0_9EUKA